MLTRSCLLFFLPLFCSQWTFFRIFGIQEPASALFSVLNLVATYLAWRRYCHRILRVKRKDEPAVVEDPFFITTTISAILGMNAWLWSTVFHVHDFPLTEVQFDDAFI